MERKEIDISWCLWEIDSPYFLFIKLVILCFYNVNCEKESAEGNVLGILYT